MILKGQLALPASTSQNNGQVKSNVNLQIIHNILIYILCFG